MGRFGASLVFSAVTACLLMQSAQAVHLDMGGRGQVLLYPYYTVNNGQQTLLSVTNTSSVAQAVKVRFLEGYNGRDIFDFNLFLSPFDSWTGTVFALRDAGINSDGAAVLSRDTSCTAQLFSEDGTSINGTPYVAFRDFNFLTPADGGPYTSDRTREGSIEIIAMANLDEALSSAIAHGSNGSPSTGCAQVRNLAFDNAGVQSAPSGGLMGSVSVIDGGRGTYLSARAEALAWFTGVGIFAPFNRPGYDGLPNLASVNDGLGTVLGTRATANIFDANGSAQSLTYPGPDSRSRRVDAVSAVLMADRIYNEYQISLALGAASDWLLSLPTKPFYTDPQYVGYVQAVAVPPFEYVYNGSPNSTNRYAPTQFSRLVYSRDGIVSGAPTTYCGLCPPGQPFPPSLTRMVNVVPVNRAYLPLVTESAVLKSRLLSPIALRSLESGAWYDAGSMRFNLDPSEKPHTLLPSADGKVLRGLPVIGFWASNIVNNNVADGVLANYAAAVRHASSVTCVKDSDGTPCD